MTLLPASVLLYPGTTGDSHNHLNFTLITAEGFPSSITNTYAGPNFVITSSRQPYVVLMPTGSSYTYRFCYPSGTQGGIGAIRSGPINPSSPKDDALKFVVVPVERTGVWVTITRASLSSTLSFVWSDRSTSSVPGPCHPLSPPPIAPAPQPLYLTMCRRCRKHRA